MMRKIRMCLAGVAAAALLVVALPASGASAAKVLVMKEGATTVAVGAPANIGVIMAGCSVWSTGSVAINKAAKDKVTGAPASTECGPGVTASGGITEILMGATGKVKMAGTIEISKPGPCVYVFSKWKGEFPVPGVTIIETSTAGKLNKVASSKSCEKKDTEEYAAGATSSEFEPFEEAL